MRGGTGRLPGRDDARDPDMYMFLLFLSHTVYIWRRDVFRPVSPSRDPGFSNRDPGLSGTIFAIKILHPAVPGTITALTDIRLRFLQYITRK